MKVKNSKRIGSAGQVAVGAEGVVRPVSLSLDESSINIFKKLGDGKISVGARRAAQIAAPKGIGSKIKPAPPPPYDEA